MLKALLSGEAAFRLVRKSYLHRIGVVSVSMGLVVRAIVHILL